MGRVRTKTIKRASKQMIEKFFGRMTVDFDLNKRVADEVANMPSKRVRNKVAGYATRLMRRIEKGPVRGISLKLQEEERERRMEYVPKQSAFTIEDANINKDAVEMISELGFELPQSSN